MLFPVDDAVRVWPGSGPVAVSMSTPTVTSLRDMVNDEGGLVSVWLDSKGRFAAIVGGDDDDKTRVERG